MTTIDPVLLIKRDHRKVEKLFKEYEDLGDRAYATKEKKASEILLLLKGHAEMEELFLYGRLKQAFGKDGDAMVEEAIAEHGVAKRLLEELSVTHPDDPQFDARMKVLNENVTHHVMEEEQELLPAAEKALSQEALEKIGRDMQQFKADNKLED